MNLFSKKANRKALLNKLIQYRKVNKYNDNNYFREYINIIEKEFLKSTFISNSDFLIKGRRKFLIEEFYKVLQDEDDYNKKHCIGDPLYFALGNLEEILHGNNTIYFDDRNKENQDIQESGNDKLDWIYFKKIKDINEKYNNKKIICLEEKELIEKMIKYLKNKLK